MSKINPFVDIDQTDLKLIELMISSHANKNTKQMSTNLGISLSTVQRRIRNMIEKGVIVSRFQVDYEKIGYRKGLIHVYKMDGNSKEIIKAISKLKGITSIETHIGDSDILVSVIYKMSSDLSDIINGIKHIDGIKGIT
jgi:Lrp/AsnC family transcriptional regulator, regulator for asnA, asnC and gidA